ncbi:MAG TPA: YgjP-like metallopeptidase domain-containing protein [Dongiaceae bacterium]|jgi:hypothetical protein|nr:YgjP-like metallopeptidase domain-containing protein [Dongiaceae bacterium]
MPRGNLSKLVDLDGIPLLVRRNRRARRILLRVSADARQAILTLSPRHSEREALRFARDKREWLAARLGPAPALLGEGSIIPFRGDEIRIAVSADPRTASRLENNVLTVGGPMAGARVRRFLREEARRALTELAQEKAAHVGCACPPVRVKELVSRWGSCGSCLNFSWRLILAPHVALDYVVAHEVAHLRHRNHGAAFWSLCRELSADFAQGHTWLKREGSQLHRLF